MPGYEPDDAVGGDQRPFLRARLPLIACACVLGLALAASGVGLSAYRSMRLQAEYGRALVSLAEISGAAGRIDAIVAELADPRSDPARYDDMRRELRDASARLGRIGRGLCPASGPDAAPDADAARVARILCSAVRKSRPELLGFVRDYAASGTRAARPDADLAPGMLLRGDLDGLYGNLVQAADEAKTVVQREQVRSLHRWRTLVTSAAIALLALASALSALVIGPLAALIHRNRMRERAAIRSRLQTAAYISQVIESIDVGVLAVDGAGRCITVNSAARTMLDVEDGNQTIPHALSRPGRLWSPGSPAPLDDGSLPLTQALAGQPFPATELRLLPARVIPPPRGGSAGDLVEDDVHERRIVVRALPLSTHDGQPMGALATFQDVTELHVTNGLLAKRASDLAALSDATRAIQHDEDARRAACQAALAISGAVMAGLFEPDAGGDLVCSSASGADIVGLRFERASSSVMAEVLATGRPRTTADVASHQGANLAVVRHLSTLCGHPVHGVAWIPVTTGQRTLAVLALAFTDRIDAAAHLPTLEILAAETAGAMERQDLLKRLATEAETDPLTGTANRRAWETALTGALGDPSNAGMLSIIILDVDHFKSYNDAHGHPAGDLLLRQAAHAWRGRLRSHDLLARYGGEEFTVMLTNCDLDQAVEVADALRSLVPVGQTCSAGVASWDGHESSTALIDRADAALYSAKRAGRDRTIAGR